MSDHMTENQTTEKFSVSEKAAKRINEIMATEETNTMLRISVSGGGCSGFQYHFDLTNERNDDDIAIEKDGATVVIDTMSLMYMEESQIDFVDDLIGASFQINNPNATSGCGCGTSFAL